MMGALYGNSHKFIYALITLFMLLDNVFANVNGALFDVLPVDNRINGRNITGYIEMIEGNYTAILAVQVQNSTHTITIDINGEHAVTKGSMATVDDSEITTLALTAGNYTKREAGGTTGSTYIVEAVTMQVNYYLDSLCTVYAQQWNVVTYFGNIAYYVSEGRSWNIAYCTGGVSGQPGLCRLTMFETANGNTCANYQWDLESATNGRSETFCNTQAPIYYPPECANVYYSWWCSC